MITFILMVGIFVVGVGAEGFRGNNEPPNDNTPSNNEDVSNHNPSKSPIQDENSSEGEEVIEIIGEVNDNPDEEKIPLDEGKVVFLTFDDGPTKLTPLVLEVLEEKEVKATFFTLGKLIERNPEILKETQEAGHSILPHSYSHDYAIYSTLESFYEDFYKAEEALTKALGTYPPPIFRFIGGSSNHSSFEYGGQSFMNILTADINEKGYYYMDWNIDSGDSKKDTNGNTIKDHVLEASEDKNLIVILFHDTERNTAMLEVLPEIIDFYKAEGYRFKTVEELSTEEIDKMIELRLINRVVNR